MKLFKTIILFSQIFLISIPQAFAHRGSMLSPVQTFTEQDVLETLKAVSLSPSKERKASEAIEILKANKMNLNQVVNLLEDYDLEAEEILQLMLDNDEITLRQIADIKKSGGIQVATIGGIDIAIGVVIVVGIVFGAGREVYHAIKRHNCESQGEGYSYNVNSRGKGICRSLRSQLQDACSDAGRVWDYKEDICNHGRNKYDGIPY